VRDDVGAGERGAHEASAPAGEPQDVLADAQRQSGQLVAAQGASDAHAPLKAPHGKTREAVANFV
jgi:hypothetical protein